MVKKMSDIIFKIILISFAILYMVPTVVVGIFSLSDGFKSFINFFIWEPQLINALINSIIVALLSATGSTIVSIGAAYVFSFCKFKCNEFIYYIYIIVMMMPFQVTLLPQYIFSGKLHIYDSLEALIYPAIFSPFSVFLLTQIMKSFDKDILDAAKMDTSSEVYILLRIVLPCVRPGIICAWVLVFCEQWNAVAEPLVLLETFEKFPLSVLINSNLDDNLLFATASVYMILPILFYVLFESEVLNAVGEYKL